MPGMGRRRFDSGMGDSCGVRKSPPHFADVHGAVFGQTRSMLISAPVSPEIWPALGTNILTRICAGVVFGRVKLAPTNDPPRSTNVGWPCGVSGRKNVSE